MQKVSLFLHKKIFAVFYYLVYILQCTVKNSAIGGQSLQKESYVRNFNVGGKIAINPLYRSAEQDSSVGN